MICTVHEAREAVLSIKAILINFTKHIDRCLVNIALMDRIFSLTDDRYLLNIALFIKVFQNLSFQTNGAP